MRKVHLLGIAIMLFALAVVTGCGNPPSGTPKVSEKVAKKGGEDDHDHGPGPHGGTIIEFGKYHGEFSVNHKDQEATVYILGSDAKKAAPIKVEKLLLSIKSPQFQVDLKAVPQAGDRKGRSSRFVAKHENFGKEQEFEGTLSGVIDGKPYAGDFKEEPESEKGKK